MHKFIITLLFSITFSSSFSQARLKDSSQVYRMKYAIDVPVAVGGSAWTLYAFGIIYDRDSTTAAEILALNRNNVNSFDRPVTRHYSPAAFRASNIFFYGSMPLPAILFFDKKIRKDAGKIGLLYLEAMAATGTVYTISAMSANRFRPYTYNPDVDLSKRTRGGGRNSFFAGHVAIVGTSTFFMAQVISDYHPEWKNKWVFYGIAGAMTATTGILRMEAGEHFRTDVLVGMAVGTASGIFIPRLHRNKFNKPSKLAFSPYFNGDAKGFTVTYKLGNN